MEMIEKEIASVSRGDFLGAKCSESVMITPQHYGQMDTITPADKFDLSLSVKMLQAGLLVCSYDSVTHSFGKDDHGAKH